MWHGGGFVLLFRLFVLHHSSTAGVTAIRFALFQHSDPPERGHDVPRGNSSEVIFRSSSSSDAADNWPLGRLLSEVRRTEHDDLTYLNDRGVLRQPTLRTTVLSPGRATSSSTGVVKAVSIPMYLHPAPDAISGQIKAVHNWEQPTLVNMRKVLAKLGKPAVFLDMGMNLGVYSLVAAADGHDVLGFEMMKSSWYKAAATAQEASGGFWEKAVAGNHKLASRIRLFDYALADEPGDIVSWQDEASNVGGTAAEEVVLQQGELQMGKNVRGRTKTSTIGADQHLVVGARQRRQQVVLHRVRRTSASSSPPSLTAAAKQRCFEQNPDRGDECTTTTTLDTLLAKGAFSPIKKRPVFLKMDLEGSECLVLKGARRFFDTFGKQIFYAQVEIWDDAKIEDHERRPEDWAPGCREEVGKVFKKIGLKFVAQEGDDFVYGRGDVASFGMNLNI